MKPASRILLAVAAGTAAASPVIAADMSIKLTLPTFEGSGRQSPRPPYVAVWLRKADKSFAGNLAVWYEVEKKGRRGGGPGAGEGGPGMGGPGMAGPGGFDRGGDRGGGRQDNPNTPGGARWLNEVREWWADSGNQLKFPVDGLTTASRAAGTYELTFSSSDPKLAKLPAGNYLLMVEAAREHGGDEAVSIPFSWPVKAPQAAATTGKTELGAVALALKP